MQTEKILIKRGKEILFQLDLGVFSLLFDSTVMRRSNKYYKALDNKEMNFDGFRKMARDAEVPYPLFFLSEEQAENRVKDYVKRVFFGTSKGEISIASRGDINRADISLILKDLTRKQILLKEFITEECPLPKCIKKSSLNVAEQAESIRAIIGYDIHEIENLNKERSYNHLVNCLARNNVFVSLYSHGYCPQDIPKKLCFSGIAINDKHCPFLFVKAGDYDSSIEPWGRRMFTIGLLLSSLCYGECKPVTMDGKSRDLSSNKHYLFAEEFLMPEYLIRHTTVTSRLELDSAARKFAVSPSAMVLRLFRLGIFNDAEKEYYLDELEDEYQDQLQKRKGGNRITPDKGILRYNNPELVKRYIDFFDNKRITERQLKHLLCYRKGENVEIETLRQYG